MALKTLLASSNFDENPRIYSKVKLITGVKDTGNIREKFGDRKSFHNFVRGYWAAVYIYRMIFFHFKMHVGM
jgi:hypothetical protein